MKAHLHQIPEGDTLHLEGEESAVPLELDQAGAMPVSPLSYSLDIGRSGSGVFATGRLGVRVRMQCVVCLEDFEFDLVAEPFALQTELTGSESIDLTPFIREDMHLLLPAHPRCDTNGGLTCPAQHNGAADAGRRSSQSPASAWDALNKLKIKTK
jgi:uncharacterized metal-binding protein YceD (DUF177 family)